MFKEATIHYPNDECVLALIHKEIATFQCNAIVKYVETLNLSGRQIKTLYVSLAEDIAKMKQSEEPVARSVSHRLK